MTEPNDNQGKPEPAPIPPGMEDTGDWAPDVPNIGKGRKKEDEGDNDKK